MAELFDTGIALVQYTPAELMKIRISGVLLAVAVLIFTYVLYQYVRHRAANWERKKQMEEMQKNHIKFDYEDYRPKRFSIDKRLLYGFGGLIMLAGAVMAFVV